LSKPNFCCSTSRRSAGPKITDFVFDIGGAPAREDDGLLVEQRRDSLKMPTGLLMGPERI